MEMRQRQMQHQFRWTPQHPSSGGRFSFSSPIRPSLGAFRTPQHPSMGANHWGGASPLLVRNIPKESLEQRYQMLNNDVRTLDQMFFQPIEDDFLYLSEIEASKCECPPTPSRRSRRFLSKLWPNRKQINATPAPVPVPAVVSSQKKRIFGRWDPKKKWPNGWC